MKPILAGFIILVSLSASAKDGEEKKLIDKHAAELKTLVHEKIMVDHLGVGAAVGIIENGQMRTFTIGKADLKHSRMITENSLFEIGSISKTFTSMALADMVNEGKVKLTDPISKYLPESVKIPQKGDKPITLLSLTTHNSGLPRLPSNLDVSDTTNPYADYGSELLYEFLNQHQLSRSVGEKREYSNLGVGLLGHILGIADGEDYEQVIQNRVLTPLTLKQTFLHVPDTMLNEFVDGHDHNLKQAAHWDFKALAGAGAIRSSLHDMMIYLEANLQADANNKALSLSHNAQVDFGNPKTDIGLGWLISKTEEGNFLWHNGGTAGFRTFIGFDKEAQKGIVLLANSFYELDDFGRAYLANKLDEMVDELKQQPVVVDVNKLDKLVGIYALTPSFKLTVTQKKGSLFVQATGQGDFQVFPKSATEFYYKVVKATIIFKHNKKGELESLTLFQNGQEMVARPE